MLVLFRAREAGHFGEVAALHSDHFRQVTLYYVMTLTTFLLVPAGLYHLPGFLPTVSLPYGLKQC